MEFTSGPGSDASLSIGIPFISFGDGVGSNPGLSQSGIGISNSGHISSVGIFPANNLLYVDNGIVKNSIKLNFSHISSYRDINSVQTGKPIGFIFEFNNEITARNIFEFAANNAKVEFGLYGLRNIQSQEIIWLFITTHNPNTLRSTQIILNYFEKGWVLFYDGHNHPNGNPNPSFINYILYGGDIARKDYLNKYYKSYLDNPLFYIYTKGGYYNEN